MSKCQIVWIVALKNVSTLSRSPRLTSLLFILIRNNFCAGLRLHLIILQSFDLWFSQLLVGSEDFHMRVFKDDEMIAEITGTEVSTSSSFEEAILHPAIKSTLNFLLKLLDLKLRPAIGAHIWGIVLRPNRSSTPRRLPVHVSRSGCKVMLWGHVSRTCSKVMFWGHGPRSCSAFIFHGHVPWSCSMVMFHGHVPWSCMAVMVRGHGPSSCFQAMVQAHALLSCSTVMLCGVSSQVADGSTRQRQLADV